ncbi:methyl-accepting chemotaxis protein [Salinisphaera hydrothermalis]|uniref:Methyl-accepting chemotaxis sensory transducer n=1 Tax=Salinisphaera hydrothermalis (strain C41B8) TaxID=1304275 RepID=A0A084IN64_SALHC|nr:methyl-accepting chemotaxis protein [Salinisphaera hydrothermalis]KEZ78148.1 methyl-accepting chemotaxis sensory transducer [Salinisphaera hydrothermalis C41B8]
MLNVRKSVRAKLGLGLGLTFVLVAALVAVSVGAITLVNRATTEIYRSNIVGGKAIARSQALLSGLNGDIKIALNSSAQSANVHDLPKEITRVRQRVNAAWAQYYPALAGAGDEARAAKKTQAELKQIDAALGRFVDTIKDQGTLGAATFYGMSLRQPFEQLNDEFDTLAGYQSKAGAKAFAEEQHIAHLARLGLMGFGGAVLLVTLLSMIWLVRMIMRPLAAARGAVEAIADGNLSATINNPYRDEFGAMLGAIEVMRERLARVVARVRGHAESVSGGVGEIASGNEELSTRTQQQAASLEETAASMEQMTSTVRQNADNAAQADQLARTVRDQARSGADIVGQAVASMQAIDEVSRRIAENISLIDDIAFQTNLLALNASVEAARAGEQGRGFAVVATEVRNLATRSAAAAKEINALVTDSTAKVAEGSRDVGRSGETLQQITGSINQVSDVVAEIAAASKEQTGGIEQVNQAVTQMDGMTQQNAALVEESAAASRSLTEQARELIAEVAFFRLDNEAESAAVAHDNAPKRASVPIAVAQPTLAGDDAPAETKRPAPAAEPRRKEADEPDDADWATF